jgi:heme oxygenase (mycobilin-producing)
MSRVRVLVWHRVPAAERGAVEAAYRRISAALRGTPGLLGNELLAARGEPDRVLVMSEWQSLDAFEAWERGTGHRATTAPLRRYRDGDRSFEVYEVTERAWASADGSAGR